MSYLKSAPPSPLQHRNKNTANEQQRMSWMKPLAQHFLLSSHFCTIEKMHCGRQSAVCCRLLSLKVTKNQMLSLFYSFWRHFLLISFILQFILTVKHQTFCPISICPFSFIGLIIMFSIEEIRTVFVGFFFFVFGKFFSRFLKIFSSFNWFISNRQWILFLILQPATLSRANNLQW